MKETCNKCQWWVNETNIGEYEHKEAVKENKGFCIMQDLFTYKEPTDECGCNGFLRG